MKRQHKSQSSMEFVILITFLLLFFIITVVFIQARISEANEVKDRNHVNQLKNVIFNEIKIAKAMPYNYTKEFYLPIYIEGSDYTINVTDGIELVINYKDKEYVYFFSQDFNDTSTLNRGNNNISKIKNINIDYKFN